VAEPSSTRPDSDLTWLAEELVRFVQRHSERVLVDHELYLLAARRPALRPAVDHWLSVLGDLIGRHTSNPVHVRACAAVDGYILQMSH
jgi:hypothetical protein